MAQNKFILLQFYESEVWNQGANKATIFAVAFRELTPAYFRF